MALELSGIEISADIATLLTVTGAYIGYITGKQKEKRERDQEKYKKNFTIVIEHMKPLIPIVQELIDFINKINDFRMPETEEEQKKAMEYLHSTNTMIIQKLQKALNQFQLDTISCSSETMDYVSRTKKEFMNIMNDKEREYNPNMFIVYSMVNLIYNLYKNIHDEKIAKQQVEAIFPVGNDLSKTLDKYENMKKEYNI
ncbi:MAG: hypothetical protein AB7E13_09795 [Arcobacteraceae bacterium]